MFERYAVYWVLKQNAKMSGAYVGFERYAVYWVLKQPQKNLFKGKETPKNNEITEKVFFRLIVVTSFSW